MTLHCEHEQDLLDTIAANRWPDRADAALGHHVRGCASCSDVVP